MKSTVKTIFTVMTLAFFGLSMTSCGNSGSNSDGVEQTGPEYTSAYICPMHCKGSGSAEAGTCPVCKMDLKKNDKI